MDQCHCFETVQNEAAATTTETLKLKPESDTRYRKRNHDVYVNFCYDN